MRLSGNDRNCFITCHRRQRMSHSAVRACAGGMYNFFRHTLRESHVPHVRRLHHEKVRAPVQESKERVQQLFNAAVLLCKPQQHAVESVTSCHARVQNRSRRVAQLKRVPQTKEMPWRPTLQRDWPVPMPAAPPRRPTSRTRPLAASTLPRAMTSKYAKRFKVPPGFSELLKDFTKEYLRAVSMEGHGTSRQQVYEFGHKYFEGMLQERQASEQRMDPAHLRERITQLFRASDRDSSGFLDRREFKAAFVSFAEELGLSSADVRRIMAEADVNGDGVIDYNGAPAPAHAPAPAPALAARSRPAD